MTPKVPYRSKIQWCHQIKSYFLPFDLNDHFNLFFWRFHLFIFGERGREGEREGEKHQWVREMSICCTPPAGDPARNTGMRPDWESNQWHSGAQANAQSTEPQQQGLMISMIILTLWEGDIVWWDLAPLAQQSLSSSCANRIRSSSPYP